MSEEKDKVAPSVPIARVKRIIKQDDDVVSVSSGAVYAVAAATELFASYFTEQAYLNAQSDKRSRLTYDDFATAVSNVDQLEFLTDMVPKRVPFKKMVERRNKQLNSAVDDSKQTTLAMGGNGLTVQAPKPAKQDDQDTEDEKEDEKEEDEKDQQDEDVEMENS